MTAAIASAVIACGGLAAVARFLVAAWFPVDGFPWAVLTVNVVGSALAGAVLALAAGLGEEVTVVMLSGVAGGLTTFSTFSVETVQLVVAGRARVAALNVVLNVGAGLVVTAIAYAVAAAFG